MPHYMRDGEGVLALTELLMRRGASDFVQSPALSAVRSAWLAHREGRGTAEDVAEAVAAFFDGPAPADPALEPLRGAWLAWLNHHPRRRTRREMTDLALIDAMSQGDLDRRIGVLALKGGRWTLAAAGPAEPA